jgi:RHS repeat-associated protein
MKKFFPYGVERPSPPSLNDTEKFTGYFRDAETGNDYADQRYMSPGMGRFITPDRGANPRASDSGSWNLYAYTRGDPVNRVDRHGTDDDDPDCIGDICQLIFSGEDNPPSGAAGACFSFAGLLSAAGMDMDTCAQVIASGCSANGNVSAFTSDQISPEQAAIICGVAVGQPVAYTPSCQTFLINTIDNFLAGSPMAGLGTTLVANGQTFSVDPRFVVGLAVAESLLGRNQGTACNDFGYYYNGKGNCSPFNSPQSPQSEIYSVTKNIRRRHLNPPASETTAAQVYAGGGALSYCHGNCSQGLTNLTNAMTAMDGNPNSLISPCNPDGTWKTQ